MQIVNQKDAGKKLTISNKLINDKFSNFLKFFVVHMEILEPSNVF